MVISLMENNTGYEVLHEQKQVGRIVWTLEDTIMVMNGTYLDDSLRGQNMGKQLLNHAADFARTHGYKMKAVCPYVIKQFERVTDYNDVKMS